MSGEALHELKAWWTSIKFKAYTAFALLVVGVGWNAYSVYKTTDAFISSQKEANVRFEQHMVRSDKALAQQEVLNDHLSSREDASEARLRLIEEIVFDGKLKGK